MMMALLFLALVASSIVLPTIVVAYRELTSRLMGRGPWLDYEESAHIHRIQVELIQTTMTNL